MFATPSGDNSAGCQNCDTTTTPLWRKSEDGTTLCNACGLFLKLHGRARPIALKSNVIRSRNRVKTPQSGQKRKTPYDAPATPGEIARQQQFQQTQQISSPSPYEPHPRTLMTPCQNDDTHAQFTENVFDPQLSHPANQILNTAQSFDDGTHINGSGDPASRNPNEQDQDLEEENAQLRARVNELEIINDLFRSRVTELEAKQQQNLPDVTQSSEVDVQGLMARIAELELENESLKKEKALDKTNATPF